MPATRARLTRAVLIRPARVIYASHSSPFGCPRGTSRQPTAAHGLVEAQDCLQARQPRINEVVLGRKQSLLYHEQGDKVDSALTQSGLADIESALRSDDDLLLQPFTLHRIGNRNERLLDIDKTRNDGLSIEVQQLDLPAFCQFQLPFKQPAIEDRLSQVRCNIVKNRLRGEQVLERRTHDPVFSR